MQTYLVGGAVRDQLLGLTVKDRDWVVVGSTPAELLSQGYKQVGKDFPVFLHPESGEEYALARTEKKTGRGYTGFACDASPKVTLEEDLLRRDLTINAIAQTPAGDLIDPFNGQQDLQDRILRHVSEAFVEDPLRILRIARFAAQLADFNFQIAPETKILMRRMVRQGEVADLVAERVWQELHRALMQSQPQIFLEVLRECGALAVLFPELDQLFGVPNPPEWHPEIDSGVHTLMVLKQAAVISPDPKIRFAALIHDLGKGITPEKIWPRHTGHGPAGVALIKDLCQRYPVPRDYAQLAILVSRFHIDCHRCQFSSANELLGLLEGVDAFRRPERFQEFLLVCEADVHGRGIESTTKPYQQKDFLQKVFTTADQVTAQNFVKQGLKGPAIAKAIHQARLNLINEVLKD